jgi:hypothetical protein
MSNNDKLLKPKNLSDEASAQWDRLAGELASSGVTLTAAHRAPLTLASTIAADIREDWKELQAEGTYHAGKNGIQTRRQARSRNIRPARNWTRSAAITSRS